MTASEHCEQIQMVEPHLPKAATEALTEVVESGAIEGGEEVRRFESEFSSFCGTAYGIATKSGVAAREAALAALGLGDGSTVLVAALAPISTLNAIRSVGAKAVFVDIDPETHTLDPAAAEQVINRRNSEIDALVVAHLDGLPAEMDPLQDLANSYDIPLVEDASQAHGANYRGRPVGSLGDVGFFSFSPTRNLTTGSGGIVVTNSDDIAAEARQYVEYGCTDRQDLPVAADTHRMGELNAALGRAQLERLPTLLRTRRDNASQLRSQLSDTDVRTPAEPDHVTHAYNQFTIRCRRRDDLKDHLEEFGIESAVRFPRPLQECASNASTADAPAASAAADEMLALPVHPTLSESEVATVGEAVRYFDSFV